MGRHPSVNTPSDSLSAEAISPRFDRSYKNIYSQSRVYAEMVAPPAREEPDVPGPHTSETEVYTTSSNPLDIPRAVMYVPSDMKHQQQKAKQESNLAAKKVKWKMEHSQAYQKKQAEKKSKGKRCGHVLSS